MTIIDRHFIVQHEVALELFGFWLIFGVAAPILSHFYGW